MEKKDVKINQPAAVGIVFGVMFWLIFNSIVLGVLFGVVFYMALRGYDKR